jgi:hypothetical protein
MLPQKPFQPIALHVEEKEGAEIVIVQMMKEN